MSSAENEIEELESSELGTKSYWEECYETEIKNYKSHGDFGEVWFDEDSQIRVLNWMLKCDNIEKTDKVLDCGCGNGIFFLELNREGFTDLTGIDYSPKAIILSESIAKDQNLNAKYKVADLLCLDLVNEIGKFKIVHDKGTYDAISLHPTNPKEKRETYINNIYNVLENDGYFIITSCNWTKIELIKSFERTFKLNSIIPTPQFKFGGKIGNVVTSLVFQKIL